MTGSVRTALLPDRAVLALEGPDRASFLQGLVTNDIRQLAPDRALYAGLLTPQGKLLYDFFLIEDGTRILIECAAATAAALAKRLTLYKLRAAVQISDRTAELKVAAFWGLGAAAHLALEPAEGAARPGPHDTFVDPRLAALGARAIYPVDASIQTDATLVEYTQHRLALGIGDGAEIAGEACYPLEANFETLHGVDFKKGCYVGQELTARMKHKGGLRKRVLPVTGTGALPEAGTPVTHEDTSLGEIIAASGPNGLALLRLDKLAQGGTLSAAGVTLSVHWPGWLPR
jgi:folate-binding protein YgfZ